MCRSFRSKSAKQRGFTLIEVMVVVVILGVLGALIVPQIMNRPDQAKVTAARSDLQAIATALEIYRLDNFDYPSTEQGLLALTEEPRQEPLPRHWSAGGYLKAQPKDPWGNAYHYDRESAHEQEFDLSSFGADGRPGGSGNNADIGNWVR